MTQSAQQIFESAPLGAVIAWCDGTPRPPQRHVRKAREWESRNGQGRLVSRTPSVYPGCPDMFTAHEKDFGSGGTIVLRVNRVLSVTSDLAFTVVSIPEPGSALVLTTFAGDDELKHIASSRANAEAWMVEHGYFDARVEIVTAAHERTA